MKKLFLFLALLVSLGINNTKAMKILSKYAIISSITPLLFFAHNDIMPFAAYARNLPESTGASGEKIGTIEALIPIFNIQKKVNSINELLGDSGNSNYHDIALSCNKILTEIPFIDNETKFKRVFDEYSQGISYKQVYKNNNAFLIYYTKGFDGIDRPSIEIQDQMEVLQGKQYGYRNEIWIGIDESRSELSYLLSQSNLMKNDLSDLVDYITQTKAALDNYIQLAPPQQLEVVRNNK